MDPSNFYTQGGYWVEITAIVHHIENQGSRAQQHFNELAEDGYYDDGGSKAYVIAQVAQFAIILITRLLSLKAERDANNDAAETEAPPVMPVDFAKMTPRLFIKDVLEPRRSHLHASKWTDDEVYKIEQEQRQLHQAYTSDLFVKNVLDKQDYQTMFNDGWDALDTAQYKSLRQYAAGLETVFPNTTSVESDFSILKWEKDEF
ncbi:unnamed protein product, partial [Aphanomyces euteiches]